MLVVISEADPVAVRVAAHWGTPPSTGDHLDGAAIRRLPSGAFLVRRPMLHIHDERLDLRLPSELRESMATLVFPSIHRSEQNVHCLTVHPLGNLGPEAEVGGRPRVVNPTDPGRMATLLRRLDEAGLRVGLRATFEATHHGPELALPSMFVEIGYGTDAEPPPVAVEVLAREIPAMDTEPGDRVAMAVGGGHYAPHFTDLVRKRRWAFGHIVSRHLLTTLDGPTARAAFEATRGAEGWISARAEDAGHPALVGVGARLREGEAARRSTAASGT
jgi:D-aminoacyl-tRNA deacylase